MASAQPITVSLFTLPPHGRIIRVNYRLLDGNHVYTSDEVHGLYVADKDAPRAFAAVVPSLERLIALNERQT